MLKQSSNSLPKSWVIRHLELSSSGIPDLASLAGETGIYLVLWWEEIPLGHLALTPQQLPITAPRLSNQILKVITPTLASRLLKDDFQPALPGAFGNWQPVTLPKVSSLITLEQPLKQLSEQLETSIRGQTEETISIIICTRDRAEELARCLKSLQQLTTLPEEIIVVDNAPTSDATQKITAQFPNVRYLLELRPGLSIARNTGLREAKGSLIAFTDDDVEVHRNWLQGLRFAFHDSSVMAVTGLIIPGKLDTEAEQVFEYGSTGFGWGYSPLTFHTEFFEEMKPLGVPVWRMGAGANMAFRRQIFAELGEFDERLGAGASGCSEDSEFWYRVLAAGWKCQYEPMAVVYHYHRATLKDLNQQMSAYMRGHIVALWIQALKHRHFGNLRRVFIALPRYYLKRFLLGLLYRFQGQYCTVLAEISGCLRGTFYYFRHCGDDWTQKTPNQNFNPVQHPDKTFAKTHQDLHE